MVGRRPFNQLRDGLPADARAKAAALTDAMERDLSLAELRRARLLTQDQLAADLHINQASIAKLVAGEAAMDNARDATQVHGGYGFINDYPVARHYRDSKILEVGEGTTEVQLMLIARGLGL